MDTPVRPIELGVPMGDILSQRRAGVAEIRISYVSGGYYNTGPRRFGGQGREGGPPRLSLRDGAVVLELPSARRRGAAAPAGHPGCAPPDAADQ